MAESTVVVSSHFDADPCDLAELQKAAHTILSALDLDGSELSVVLTDDAAIAELNQQWRGVEGPTDVLSFPMDEPEEAGEDGLPVLLTGSRMLGDVVISVETAERLVSSAGHRQRVAREMGLDPDSLPWTLQRELAFLLVHSVLHLIGHDHAEPAEEARMMAEEARLFQLLV